MTEEEKQKSKLNLSATSWYNTKVVGYYLLGTTQWGFRITLTEKPNVIHRLFMRLFLGFKWIDL